MNTTTDSKTLAAAARLAGKLTGRSKLPILAHVRLQAGVACLAIHSTDLDSSITVLVPAHTDTEGECCVSAKRLTEVAASSKDAVELDFKADKHTLHVLNGATYNLPTMDPDEFPPETNVMDGAQAFVIMSADLRKALKQVQFAQSTDESRYVLNGVCFELHKGRLVTVATDGRRLARQSVTCGWSEDPPKHKDEKGNDTAAENPIRLIVRSHTVGVLFGALPKDKVNVPVMVSFKVAAAFNHISFLFRSGELGVNLVSKLIDGQYPNYPQVIPKPDDVKARVQFKRTELLDTLRKAEKATTEKSNSVKITLEKNNAKFTAGSPDVGQIVLNVAINYKPGEKPPAPAYNPRYLIDTLAALDTDEVTLNLIDELAPCTITAPGEEHQTVVMPMVENTTPKKKGHTP